MRTFLIVSMSLVITLGSADLGAQTSNIPTDPFGRIFSADIVPGVFARTARAAVRPSMFSVTPSLRYSDESWSAGLGFTYARPISDTQAYQLSATYGYIKPDGADQLNRAGVTGAFRFLKTQTFTATGIATYGRVFDRFSNVGIILAVDQNLPRNFTLTYNAAWAQVDLESGPTVDDFQPAIGLSYEFEAVPVGIAADYTFENDIDAESSWSLSVERALGDTAKFNVGLEKHEVITAKFTKSF